jgi:hypothetical protein
MDDLHLHRDHDLPLWGRKREALTYEERAHLLLLIAMCLLTDATVVFFLVKILR